MTLNKIVTYEFKEVIHFFGTYNLIITSQRTIKEQNTTSEGPFKHCQKKL